MPSRLRRPLNIRSGFIPILHYGVIIPPHDLIALALAQELPCDVYLHHSSPEFYVASLLW